MKTFVQPGETITLTAPYAVSSGGGLKVGSIVGIALADAANGASVEVLVEGVVTHARATGSGSAWTVGALIYWDNSAKKFTATSTSNTLAGVAVAAAGDSDATGTLRLNGSFA